MDLSDDMLMDIFSRLPVRSLVRLRCVSKRWYDIIKSPDFVNMHLNLQLTKGDARIQTIRRRRYRFDNIESLREDYVVSGFDNIESLRCLTTPDFQLLDYQEEIENASAQVKFATHLNGIVCIFSTGEFCTGIYDYRAKMKITLWNPALREFKILPDDRTFDREKEKGSYELGSYELFIGFGFDDATNDYKVVCVERFINWVYDPRNPAIEVVQVYNLKTNSWRRLTTRTQLPRNKSTEFTSSIFFRGSVYWLVCGWGLQYPFILTFNITTELFGVVQCPQTDETEWKEYHLLLLDKSTMSFCSFSDTQLPANLDLWVMNDNNPSVWIKQCSLTTGIYISRPLNFLKDDKLLLIDRHHELICFDLSTGQLDRIRYYDALESETLDVVVCVETLVSLN